MQLKQYLSDNGIKERWFGDQVGVERQTIWRWLRGKATPPPMRRKLIEKLTKGQVKEEDWRGEDEAQ